MFSTGFKRCGLSSEWKWLSSKIVTALQKYISPSKNAFSYLFKIITFLAIKSLFLLLEIQVSTFHPMYQKTNEQEITSYIAPFMPGIKTQSLRGEMTPFPLNPFKQSSHNHELSSHMITTLLVLQPVLNTETVTANYNKFNN